MDGTMGANGNRVHTLRGSRLRVHSPSYSCLYYSYIYYIIVTVGVYGVIVLGASSNPLHSPVPPISTGPMDMYTTMDYYYWHIIELVYTYIYITLYYY